MERVVLLRVQHLQHSRRRIAVDGVGSRNLVYLIQDEHGVRRACLLDALHDAARHGADIGPAVTTNLSLIVHATQGDTHILAVQRTGNALSQRCLAHSRRTVEADNRTLQVAAQLQHGHVFENALLNLLHAVVVLVQDALGFLEVEVVLRVFAPGEGDKRLEISQLDIIVGRLRIQLVQFVQLSVESLVHFLAPLLVLGFLLQFLPLRTALARPEFFLDVLNLLLEEVLALLFVNVNLGLCLDVVLQFEQLQLPVERLQQVKHAVQRAIVAEHLYLVLQRQRKIGTVVVHSRYRIIDIVEGKGRLVGHVIIAMNILVDLSVQFLKGRVDHAVVLVSQLFFERLCLAHQVRMVLDNLGQGATSQSLHDDGHGVTRHLQQFHHTRIDADGEQVSLRRCLNGCVALADDSADGLGILLQVLDKTYI